jgi:hypothetical protein
MLLSALALMAARPDYGEYSHWHIYSKGRVCTVRKDFDEGWETGISTDGRTTTVFVGNKDWEPVEMPVMVRIAGSEAYRFAKVIPYDGDRSGFVFKADRKFVQEFARGWLMQVYYVHGETLIPIAEFSLAGAGSAVPVLDQCIKDNK